MSVIPSCCDVLVVGAGVAGASATYHLQKSGVQNIIVLDSGISGFGGAGPENAPAHAVLRDGDEDGVFKYARRLTLVLNALHSHKHYT